MVAVPIFIIFKYNMPKEIPMKNLIPSALIILFIILIFPFSCSRASKQPAIVHSPDASSAEALAASELRRYIYLRTGELLPIKEISFFKDLSAPAFVIGRSESALIKSISDAGTREKTARLRPEEYLLRTVTQDGEKKILVIAGGDPTGTLYGAYRLAEKWGIRFSLEGDVVPEGKVPLEVPDLDEFAGPLFRLRGIQPFHDFPEGPDWWNLDDYKAILGQLPKLRMNFFGLHTYPEGGPNAEPTVWIGLPGDIGQEGRVTSSYPSSYQNTARGNWGYQARKTSDFHFGASGLFERDDFGAEVMKGLCPEPKTMEDANELFRRQADVFAGAFRYARSLGIKTCVGTEIPLTIPAWVKKRLQEMGKDPKDSAVVRELYRGMFSRIAASYPIDFYWFWTWEGWTWDDASPEAIAAVTSDVKRAVEAAAELKPPFSLATCGWVLGPPSSRTLFDQILPKEIAVSCINREVGKAPVDPGFARIQGRSRWAIPWLEDDPSLTSPQLWAGRMRRDAADALRYGCDGLLGIHWRTRILSPNVLSLAWAAWDQSWNKLPRTLAEETGPITGQYFAFPDKQIEGTEEDRIYQDVRDRVFAYHIPVPDGNYSVTLKFCEGQIDRKSGRVFDVYMQGKKVIDSLDIFARAGRFRALDFSFPQVAVTGGRLAIDFADRIHYPCLAGIVIKGKNFSKKINCGGPAVLDYEADWPETERHLPIADFYQDWAASQFGPEAAGEIAAIFSKMDGRLPMPVTWVGGPGGIVPDSRPWEEVRKSYEFVSELAALEPGVIGKANQERFAYWLKNFFYMREIAHLNCLWSEFNKTLEKAKAEQDQALREKLISETLLPIRIEMVGSVRKIFEHLLATVSNTGELGTIANWEQHLFPEALEKPQAELEKLMGKAIPPEAKLGKAYDGPVRVVVPTVRTSLEAGEALNLKIIVLAKSQPREAFFYWRELGKGRFKTEPLTHVARSVYSVSLPPDSTDLEYYVQVKADGQEACFPASAPDFCQTIVRIPKR
jgi:hypothetical protein